MEAPQGRRKRFWGDRLSSLCDPLSTAPPSRIGRLYCFHGDTPCLCQRVSKRTLSTKKPPRLASGRHLVTLLLFGCRQRFRGWVHSSTRHLFQGPGFSDEPDPHIAKARTRAGYFWARVSIEGTCAALLLVPATRQICTAWGVSMPTPSLAKPAQGRAS